MSDAVKFDPASAFEQANKIAREQESQARLLLWDVVSEKAASDEKYRRQLAENPEQVIRQEASALPGKAGQQIDVSQETIDKLAEKARNTYSIVVPQIGQNKVEELIFGTIEDMRTSFKLTLRLSQVLFYAGLGMVVTAFVVALAGGQELITLLFGASGMVSMLISSLVLSPLNRVQTAACDLVQLQMAYLAYYKQLYLLGSGNEPLPKADAIDFAREIDRAAASLIYLVQSKGEKKSNQTMAVSTTPQGSQESPTTNATQSG
jgi:hypothetical protein